MGIEATDRLWANWSRSRAARFEDVEPAEAKHLGAMAQGNHEKILRWEREVLRVLEYALASRHV